MPQTPHVLLLYLPVPQYHTTMRNPKNKVANNKITAWKLFEEASRVLEATVGPNMPPSKLCSFYCAQ